MGAARDGNTGRVTKIKDRRAGERALVLLEILDQALGKHQNPLLGPNVEVSD